MRIPTGIDQSSRSHQSRRSDGGRATDRGAVRRLIRLVIALVLVIVVMDAAGDPDIYRPFFADQQSTVATPSTLLLLPQHESGAASAKEQERLVPDAGLIDHARQLMPLLSDQERTTLTHLLAWHRQRSQTALKKIARDFEHAEAVIDSVEESVESLESGVSRQDILSGTSLRYAKSLRTILSAARAASDSEPDEKNAQAEHQLLALTHQQVLSLGALQYALDETYQREVDDGTVWSADDANAFYRYLERAASPAFLTRSPDREVPSEFQPVRVGVVPLIQQPTVYHGQMVWIDGTVARASRVEAKENPFGVRHYWEVWVRPADGTDRPVVLYAPEASERIAAVGAEASLNRGPEISAVGVFLKRRLFRSVGGVEQAPVVVGRAIDPISRSVERPDAVGTANGRPLWLVVVSAAVIGVVLAAWLMWQATASAKRSRQLRHKAERVPSQLPGAADIDAHVAASAKNAHGEANDSSTDLPRPT